MLDLVTVEIDDDVHIFRLASRLRLLPSTKPLIKVSKRLCHRSAFLLIFFHDANLLPRSRQGLQQQRSISLHRGRSLCLQLPSCIENTSIDLDAGYTRLKLFSRSLPDQRFPLPVLNFAEFLLGLQVHLLTINILNINLIGTKAV